MSTNHFFTKGTIVYVNEPELHGSQFEYLDNRPLLVVSEPNQLFDSITVVPLTTRKRPGIKVCINGMIKGESTDIFRESVIEPWSPITISSKYITKTNGALDSITMKAVTKALAFHMGLTNEVPPYLKSVEYLFNPMYEIANSENISKDCMSSLVGQTHPNLKIGDKPASDINGRFNTHTGTAILDAFNNARINATEKLLDSYQSEDKPHTNEIAKVVEKDNTNKNENNKNDNDISITINKNSDVEDKFYHPRCKTSEDIIDTYLLSVQDLVKIYRRDLTVAEIEERYNIPKWHIRRLRNDFYDNLNQMTRKINKKLKKDSRNFNKLSDIEKVAACCYIDPNKININGINDWRNKVNNYRQLNHVNKIDRRVWRALSESDKNI